MNRARRVPLDRKTVWKTIRNYGLAAGLTLPAHPHMLRHACGYALADQGADTRLIQDYLGHRDIRTTSSHYVDKKKRIEISLSLNGAHLSEAEL